jgi:hypothetical protein
LGHFPLLTACFPPVLEQSKNSTLKVVGPFAELTRRISAPAPTLSSFPVAAKSRDNSGSAFTPVLFNDLPQLSEVEPNDKTNRATPIKIPAGLNGQFNKPSDRDYYEFEADKDDRLVFTGRTRSLGAPCDLSIRLFDTNGAQIAESSNTTASEGALTHPFGKAGTYRLLIEELTGASAPDFVYHIDVKRQRAGFSLSVDSDKTEKTTNGLFAVTVQCARDRYDGPITLSVADIQSCAFENATIGEKKTNTTLRIKLPDTMAPGEIALGRIVGKATIRDQPFTTTATTMPALRKAFPSLLYPPLQFDGLVWLGPK